MTTTNVGNLEIAIIALSIISCIFSSFVMLTYFMFKDLQNKVFMKLIFYISTADFFMNVVSAFGFPSNDSPLCWTQGLIISYF